MEIKYLGEKISIGNRFFYCNTLERSKFKELLTLWKNRIMDMQDGESVCIALAWDHIANFESVKCLKAIKQEEKINLYSFEWIDPYYNSYDNDYWLHTFPSQLGHISESFLATCSVHEFADL